MSMPPAMRSDSSTTVLASNDEWRSKALAEASAYEPPDPMAKMPSSGSITSPVPEMIREFVLSATARSASSRRKMRSVRQSFASSTAARVKFPRYSCSFVSNFSNSVKASAVAPANPAKTESLYIRRNFFALCFMTVVPTVTCPSQPMWTEAGKVGQVTRRLGHQALDAAGGETTSALVSEQRAGSCPSRQGPPIRRKRPHGVAAEGHDPLLSSLAQNRGDPLVQIH